MNGHPLLFAQLHVSIETALWVTLSGNCFRTWAENLVLFLSFNSSIFKFSVLSALCTMQSHSQETKFKTAVTACYFSERLLGSPFLEYLSERPLITCPSFSVENMERFLKNENISRWAVLLHGCTLKSRISQGKSLPFFASTSTTVGLPQWLSGKEAACSAGDKGDGGSVPGLGRSPGEDNPLQYSCLGNPTDRGAWWAIVHGSQRVWLDWSSWAWGRHCNYRFSWSQEDTDNTESLSNLPETQPVGGLDEIWTLVFCLPWPTLWLCSLIP